MRIEQTLAQLDDNITLMEGNKVVLSKVFNLQVLAIKVSDTILLVESVNDTPIERCFRLITFKNNESLLIIIDLRDGTTEIDAVLYKNVKDSTNAWKKITQAITQAQTAIYTLSQITESYL